MIVLMKRRETPALSTSINPQSAESELVGASCVSFEEYSAYLNFERFLFIIGELDLFTAFGNRSMRIWLSSREQADPFLLLANLNAHPHYSGHRFVRP